MKSFVPLALILFVGFAHAKDVESSAGGDICDVRPDLCGGAPLPKKKKTVRRHPASSSRAGTISDSSGKRRPKCRQRGASYGLDEEDLPICGSEAAKAAEEVESDLADMELERKTRPARRPAARERTPLPAQVTYDSYLQANAQHPAIARRPASMLMNQKAFVQPAVRATITGSTLDQPAQDNAAAAPGRGVGDAAPSSNGINPGDAPSSSPSDGTNGSPLR